MIGERLAPCPVTPPPATHWVLELASTGVAEGASEVAALASPEVVCWKCESISDGEHGECPVCFSWLHPKARGISVEAFADEQQTLRQDLGLPTDGQTMASLAEWAGATAEAPPDFEEPDGTDTDVAYDRVHEPFETDNPFLQRVFEHKMYGGFPDRCLAMLDALPTVGPDEQLMASLKVRHGQYQRGYLLITTDFLRYVRAGVGGALLTTDEFWSLDDPIEFNAFGEMASLVTTSGDQFQVRSRWKAKAFRDLYHLLQSAIQWEDSQAEEVHEAAHHGAVSGPFGGIAEELGKLGHLRDQGILSEEEFVAAKKKLLSM